MLTVDSILTISLLRNLSYSLILNALHNFNLHRFMEMKATAVIQL